MVDANVAQAFAEGRVPSNLTWVTPEYLSQSRDEPAIGAIVAILVITSIVFGLRCYARIIMVQSFGLDDWIAGLCYICFVTFSVLCLILIYQGSGRHITYIQYVLTLDQTNETEVYDYAAHLIYTTALFLARLSGLAFFSRLCRRHTGLSRAIRAAACFLLCAYLPQFFLILAHCNPVTGLWPYAWQSDSANYTCLNWGVVYVTNSGLSLVCDFVTFSIPVAMLWALQLSRGRKIMLAFILMPGVIVIGISCARLWLCVVGQWASDGSWFYDPQLSIEVAEVGTTLMALSVPAMKPMIGQWFKTAKNSWNGSRRRSTAPTNEVELSGRPRKDSTSPEMVWRQAGTDGGKVKTHVMAGSTSTADHELLDPAEIMVQTDVETASQRHMSMCSDPRLARQVSLASEAKEPLPGYNTGA